MITISIILHRFALSRHDATMEVSASLQLSKAVLRGCLFGPFTILREVYFHGLIIFDYILMG